MKAQRIIIAAAAAMTSLANAFVTNTFTPRKNQIYPFEIPRVKQPFSSSTQRHLFFWDKKSSDKNDRDEQSSKIEKDLVQSKSPPSSSTTDKELVPRITTVNELQDFLDFLGEDERLCVVKFHAKWCKSCQKFGVKYHHLALEEADKLDPLDPTKIVEKGRVRFAQVEFTANAKLCRSLKIKRLPYIHFYKACAGRLTHFSCGPTKFQKVVDQMNEYLGMSDEEIKFAVAMEEGQNLGDELAAGLKEQHEEIKEEALNQHQQIQNSKDSTASSP